MIHNPDDRCAKLLRELKSFDPHCWDPGRIQSPGLSWRGLYALYLEAPQPPHPYVLVVAQKYERCLLAAVRQVRRIKSRQATGQPDGR